MSQETNAAAKRWRNDDYPENSDGSTLDNDCFILAEAYIADVVARETENANRNATIDLEWIRSLGGNESLSVLDLPYWDFRIVTEHSNSTFLRVHSPDSDGEWMTDLFSDDGSGVGLVKWPKTRGELLDLFAVLSVHMKVGGE